ncbi:XkdQ/YqbQ family protein [Paenibacillus daejeonensis]|uniref:XkdQ/YqbQ family protein n=1 Tax=Paenibacillus daejeonensis TaxID=135193 RepID=UPI00037D6020|nr:hypothetical protein [Paenibacillus daejeonensis]
MIEIWVTRQDGNYILPVSRVEWRGAKYRAPRSIQVDMTITQTSGRTNVIEEGNAVIFRWKGQELFRGIVFTRDFRSDGSLSWTAYDNLYYLVNNSDTYTFVNKKASEILHQICNDFQLQIGKISDTRYVKPRQVSEDDTLYDMVLSALDSTFKSTGQRYTLRSRIGKVELIENVENVHKWIIQEGVNLTDFNYSTSIEETVSRVKLRSGDEEESITAVADSQLLQSRFGVLQLNEMVFDKLNKAQLQQRAVQMLSERGKINRTFTLQSLGIVDVVAGSGIHVIVPKLGIKKGYYVDDDSHSFEGNDYSMNLTLTETDDLPDIAEEPIDSD